MASTAELAAMRRAIAASSEALGSTNPRPCVGAVVLDAGGEVVGTGVTAPIGGPHAEVAALAVAAGRARGGTIVVTLEPCCHTGRTRRCTDAVLDARLARTVYAMSDPNPVAAGGAEALRAAGVDVEGGVLADEAAAVLGPWTRALGRGRPVVTWKYAATLDGRTAATDGSSRWITGEPARVDVHRERYLSDAVIVGIGTVLADDPQLSVRDWPARRQPTRVVVDSKARTPLEARVLDDAAPTMVVVAADCDEGRVAALRDVGAEVVALPPPESGVDLGELLRMLHQRELYLALLEGGATLAASFIRAGLVDRVVGYHAPLVLGGGLPLVADLGIGSIADAVHLQLDEVSRVGRDVRIVASMRARSS